MILTHFGNTDSGQVPHESRFERLGTGFLNRQGPRLLLQAKPVAITGFHPAFSNDYIDAGWENARII